MFRKLNLQKQLFFAFSDFNNDLLQLEQKYHVRMYADSLIRFSVKCSVNKLKPNLESSSRTLLAYDCANTKQQVLI